MKKYYDIHTHSLPLVVDTSVGALGSVRIQNYEEDSSCCREGVSLSVGLHPWDVSEQWKEVLFPLESYLKQDKRIIAIGECGLDTLHNPVCSLKWQLQALEAQWMLAYRYGLPLVLHVVRHWQELMALSKRLPSLPLVVHGFRAKPSVARQLLHMGCYLSVHRHCPPDSLWLAFSAKRLLLETDNDSSNSHGETLCIKEVYLQTADKLSVSEETLVKTCQAAVSAVFPTL